MAAAMAFSRGTVSWACVPTPPDPPLSRGGKEAGALAAVAQQRREERESAARPTLHRPSRRPPGITQGHRGGNPSPRARVVSDGEQRSIEVPAWSFQRRPWGRGDLVALMVWSLAIVVFFWDAVSLRRALFYFDITEINFPYRAFFAEELRAGRFSRWCPGLYCGMPLYSESQAGYLHPLKYLLYPWLETWQAFNLDTVLSVWLTGVGTYCWLRRHVGPAGALTGAAVFGLSGFTWAHLIHTSMVNALASVPFVVWGLESSWESGRWRGAVIGGFALACQVFAGHLQDALFTGSAWSACTGSTARRPSGD